MASPGLQLLPALDVLKLGQVFTPPSLVAYMTSLLRNAGLTLEPSCGDGAFLSQLSGRPVVAIEKQAGLCAYEHLNLDFFAYQPDLKFQTIIGNPPYVRHNDILPDTRRLLDYTGFDKRTNLYMFFIAKCLDLLDPGGELIFITPRDFLKQTSARSLNAKLFALGGFTHFKDFGDSPLFKGYSPNCAVWRWQKGLNASKLDDGRQMDCINGQLVFRTKSEQGDILSDYFEVRVGAVSGADAIFQQDTEGTVPFVCSTTKRTGELRYMLYNKYHEVLLPFKELLMKRRIKKFSEANWWHWGRGYTHKTGKRIYVNCKTRDPQPFFVADTPAYDGSLLALFPKARGADPASMCDRLNSLDWAALGFQCGGRYIFSQRSLANITI